jgi:hypothetical protein
MNNAVESAMLEPTLFLHLYLGAALYEFRRCAWGLSWSHERGGLYAFIDWPDQKVLYIGETQRFSSRMPGHDVWPQAQQRGATDVYAMTFGGNRRERRSLEQALIHEYQPPCNTQHVIVPVKKSKERLAFDPFDSFDAWARQIEV